MGTLHLVGRGFERAWKIKGLVALVTIYNLFLAITVTAPVYKWFSAHLQTSRDTSQLLNGPVVRFLFELGTYNRTSVSGLIWSGFFWIALGGLLVAVFLGAGLFAAASQPEARPRLQYFFASAARFFPRFLAIFAAIGAAGVVIVLPLNLVMGAISFRLSQRFESEVLSLWLVLAQLVISALLLAYVFLIMDYSRVNTVVHPERPVYRAMLTGFLLVSRRFVPVFGMAILFALLIMALFGVYLAWRFAGSMAGTAAFLVTLVLQQVVLFGRYGLRAAMIGSEVELHEASMPTPAAVPDEKEQAGLAEARRREAIQTRVLRRLAPPRNPAVGALRRNLTLIRRRLSRP